MKKIFVRIFIICLFLSFSSILSALSSSDHSTGSERRYKRRPASYYKYHYGDRGVRKVYRHKYRIPRYIRSSDLRRIRRYERKIEKIRWKMHRKPMSHYRYMRYVRKIRKYEYKIDRILHRYRYYRR